MARTCLRRRLPATAEEPMPEPPMTPMIDVIFQLLIYFMLTMKFKDVEGKLRSQLPKKGPDQGPADNVVPKEVRIYLCVNPGSLEAHRNNKGKHEKANLTGFKAGTLDNSRAVIHVERLPFGEVLFSDNRPDARTANRQIYREAAAKATELWNSLNFGVEKEKQDPIIIDGDSEVPFEHIMGIVDALKERDVHQIEFVANCRFGEFYGNRDRRQFSHP